LRRFDRAADPEAERLGPGEEPIDFANTSLIGCLHSLRLRSGRPGGMSRAPWRWRPRHASSAFTRSISHSPGCRVARGSRGKPSRYRKIVVRSKRDGRGKLRVCGTGCTRQQHSAPPREYLLVFKDIDMTRAEESSALIGERTSSTSLEFRLGTAQRRPNCRARIGAFDKTANPASMRVWL